MHATTAHFAAQFLDFARVACPQDPLYVAVCQQVAHSPALLELMHHAPAQQAKPNLWLAALHDEVLAGSAGVLAHYFPSVGGGRAPDAQLSTALHAFVEQHSASLRHKLATRATQTNEIGRCALLWPALQTLAQHTGQTRLALFDFGCSAGLNLGVDAFRYDYGHAQRGAPAAAGVPLLACDWQGALPPDTPWQLEQRLGVDLQPLDCQDPAAQRWLQACVWPSDGRRLQRLRQALAWAQAARPAVEASTDGLARLRQWLEQLPKGVQPVLFNAWVLYYFSDADLQRYHASVDELLHSHGLAHVCAEPASLHAPCINAAPPPTPDAQLWSLRWRSGGQARQSAWAWSHAHGQWAQVIEPA